MAVRSFELDISPGGIPPIIHVSQNTEESILFTLTASGGEDIPQYTYIRGTKLKDMTGFEYSLERPVSIGGNSGQFRLTKQMTAVSGKVICEFSTQPYDSTTRTYSSANFYLLVEPAAMSDETLQSATDVRDLMSRMQAIADGAEADADRAESAKDASLNYSQLSRSYAVGDTGTREGESTDNAKYYKNQAQSSRTQANSYANQARSYATNASSSAMQASQSVTQARTYANNASDYADDALAAKQWVEQWYNNLEDAASTNY